MLVGHENRKKKASRCYGRKRGGVGGGISRESDGKSYGLSIKAFANEVTITLAINLSSDFGCEIGQKIKVMKEITLQIIIVYIGETVHI